MAPRILDSLKPLVMWDKFPVYQGFKWKTPIIYIGHKPVETPKTYTNPLRTALYYQSLLDNGQVATRAELSDLLGVSRPKVTQMLNLLKLDAGIQEYILGLDEIDERLKVLTERRLRPLVQCADDGEQRARFREIVNVSQSPAVTANPE